MRKHALLAACLSSVTLLGCAQEPFAKPDAKRLNPAAQNQMTGRKKLIAKIVAQNPPGEVREIVVSLEDFFTGNDDRGSIGCNLGEKQPPIAEFHRRLREIRSKPNVQDVLVRIDDYDDPTSWPYSDTLYIITSAPLEEVKKWVSPLLPDEVHAKWIYGKPPAAPEVKPGMIPYSVWWD
jgi:hypothetical protein